MGHKSNMKYRTTRMALTAAFLAVTTAATAYQDMADYSGIYVDPNERWRAHLIEIATGSSFERVDAAEEGATTKAELEYSVGLKSPYDLEILAAEPKIRVIDTIAAKRGDRPYAKRLAERAAAEKAEALRTAMLQPAVEALAAPVQKAVTTAAMHDDAGLPAQLAAFQKRETVREALEDATETAKALEGAEAERKLARVKSKGRFAPTQFTVKSAASDREGSDAEVRGSILAYAPAETQDATPFDALLSSAPSRDEVEMAVATPVAPTKRPKLEFTVPAPTSIIKLARRDHKWADDPLPRTAFTKKQRKCLATGIYFEARGEPAKGQAAVAQVILNRVRAPAFPDTICGVVYHNQHMRNRCQFSFTCDGIRDRVGNQKKWRQATQIANKLIDGKMWLPEVGSSTHYHADYVSPPWRRKMTRLDKIGRHIFYRTKNGGWG